MGNDGVFAPQAAALVCNAPVTNCYGIWGDCHQESCTQDYIVYTPAANGGAACPVAHGTLRSCCTLPVNECEDGTHDCGANTVCKDLQDGFQCDCKEGFVGDGTGKACKAVGPVDGDACAEPNWCYWTGTKKFTVDSSED